MNNKRILRLDMTVAEYIAENKLCDRCWTQKSIEVPGVLKFNRGAGEDWLCAECYDDCVQAHKELGDMIMEMFHERPRQWECRSKTTRIGEL